jgi:hypothetical protein
VAVSAAAARGGLAAYGHTRTSHTSRPRMGIILTSDAPVMSGLSDGPRAG